VPLDKAASVGGLFQLSSAGLPSPTTVTPLRPKPLVQFGALLTRGLFRIRASHICTTADQTGLFHPMNKKVEAHPLCDRTSRLCTRPAKLNFMSVNQFLHALFGGVIIGQRISTARRKWQELCRKAKLSRSV
jgi:hypothetical protein